MLEPLGQSQVIAYLENLTGGRQIHLISFEKSKDWRNLDERNKLAHYISASGIVWHPLTYHKTPSTLATAWDITCGVLVGLWLVFRYKITLVHARSYVPSVIALLLKQLTGVKYLFDMRGFWVDERVDGGLWPRNSRKFYFAKGFERRFLIAADHVVSLTHSAVREMKNFDYLLGVTLAVTVIPTCVDMDKFKPLSKLPRESSFVLGYVGSASTWYLFDEVVACFVELLKIRPDAKFLIINRDQHDFIRERLFHMGSANLNIELVSVKHEEVPLHISRMDAGIFFIKPVFSKQASSPTKLGEFLACGVPCLGNYGVGDMDQLLAREQVGVVLKAFDVISVEKALQQLLKLVADPETSVRCVATANRHFSLSKGVKAYEKIYNKLLG
jgi:glycosyltransferase involved in cell wall biosynthesis